ncbi:hypothetical protein NLJ89_g3781 [Agrocybe chaxingu]|uniref:Uncharacterized protein n=1 Tax=Agrocybe chaxingu TaxID=84603 RepID=A0A9W8K4L3_9AGAR|nr:hypothetical protein NLJ89_g3781 [Agrocybe chaxingu]
MCVLRLLAMKPPSAHELRPVLPQEILDQIVDILAQSSNHDAVSTHARTYLFSQISLFCRSGEQLERVGRRITSLNKLLANSNASAFKSLGSCIKAFHLAFSFGYGCSTELREEVQGLLCNTRGLLDLFHKLHLNEWGIRELRLDTSVFKFRLDDLSADFVARPPALTVSGGRMCPDEPLYMSLLPSASLGTYEDVPEIPDEGPYNPAHPISLPSLVTYDTDHTFVFPRAWVMNGSKKSKNKPEEGGLEAPRLSIPEVNGCIDIARLQALRTVKFRMFGFFEEVDNITGLRIDTYAALAILLHTSAHPVALSAITFQVELYLEPRILRKRWHLRVASLTLLEGAIVKEQFSSVKTIRVEFQRLRRSHLYDNPDRTARYPPWVSETIRETVIVATPILAEDSRFFLVVDLEPQ